MTTNRQLCNRIFEALKKYENMYPPVFDLPKPPTGDEAEMYTIAIFIFNNININYEYYIHIYGLKLFCRDNMPYAKIENINMLINNLI